KPLITVWSQVRILPGLPPLVSATAGLLSRAAGRMLAIRSSPAALRQRLRARLKSNCLPTGRFVSLPWSNRTQPPAARTLAETEQETAQRETNVRHRRRRGGRSYDKPPRGTFRHHGFVRGNHLRMVRFLSLRHPGAVLRGAVLSLRQRHC